MDSHAAGDGVYRIAGMRGRIFGSSRVLPDAVPGLPNSPAPASSALHGAEPAGPFHPSSKNGAVRDLSAMITLLESAISAAAGSEAPPAADGSELRDSPERSYGWVCRSLPAPDSVGRYVVEFIGERKVRILAYVDGFGRAFSTDEPLDAPPAREPDLQFARFDDQPERGVLNGCVEAKAADGRWFEAALFRREGGRYALRDTWFDFGGNGEGLSYPDAMARCYLAFVHRPSLGAPEVPARGFGGIEELFDRLPALAALRKARSDIMRAHWDPALKPPVLAFALARWLEDAGLDSLALAPADALRLVRTARYADIYYLGTNEAGKGLPVGCVWALQNALNRFLLVKEELGERASIADEAEVLACDQGIVETFAQRPVEECLRAVDDDGSADGADAERGPDPAVRGEWDLRCALAREAELLRAPLRFEVAFRADVEAGIVGMRALVPGVSMMPSRFWDESSCDIGEATESDRNDQAVRYAEHLAILFAAKAFAASPRVERFEFAAYAIADSVSAGGAEQILSAFGEGGSDGHEDGEPPVLPDLFVAFGREGFFEGAEAAAAGEPYGFASSFGAAFASNASDPVSFASSDPFRSLASLPSARHRADSPECRDAELPPAAQAVLGARWMHDLRIDSDALHRRLAERLANRLSRTKSATDAIHVVMRQRDRADDPFVDRACARLMAALAEGAADPSDQNTVVDSFMGDDPCRDAIRRAQALVGAGDADGAAHILSEAAWEAEGGGRYADDAEVVHRGFDGYVSRVLYNLARSGSLPRFGGFAQADRDRLVELVPGTLVSCHLEAVKLLERSFSGMDSALAHARRAVELAPASPTPRCLLARVYMLMGDMASATASLEKALSLATQSSDIAVAYYQLAYTRWKAGDARAGAACYAKSMMTAPIMAAQAAVELQDLLGEEGLGLPRGPDVDGELERLGVPLAPDPDVLDALQVAAAGAVDADLFPVARSLLATCLHYRPDDALMGVLRSLDALA